MGFIDYKDLPSNANRDKEKRETRNVKSVVKKTPKVRKKTMFENITSAFLSTDTDSLKKDIVNNIVIPKVKETVISAVAMALGESRPLSTTRYSSVGSGGTKINYNSYSKNNPDKAQVIDYDEYIFDNYPDSKDNLNEARLVLSGMEDILDQYDNVKVADYYDLLGKSHEYSANNYGWTNLKGSKIIAYGNGFILKLPKPITLVK